MLKFIAKELNILDKQNSIITYSIFALSFIFSIIAGIIFSTKQLYSLENLYIGLELAQSSVILFMCSISIGVLLSLIQKRKEAK